MPATLQRQHGVLAVAAAGNVQHALADRAVERAEVVVPRREVAESAQPAPPGAWSHVRRIQQNLCSSLFQCAADLARARDDIHPPAGMTGLLPPTPVATVFLLSPTALTIGHPPRREAAITRWWRIRTASERRRQELAGHPHCRTRSDKTAQMPRVVDFTVSCCVGRTQSAVVPMADCVRPTLIRCPAI